MLCLLTYGRKFQPINVDFWFHKRHELRLLGENPVFDPSINPNLHPAGTLYYLT